MAKAPVAGYAKTRLIPALGAQGAACLAQRFLNETVNQALRARTGEVELCCAPDRAHRAFESLRQSGSIRLSDQGAGDLGARMARALERTLAGAGHAILIGTDAPGLDADYLRHARDALQKTDVVLGPAADGGYVLIGMRRWVPSLFDDMPWSTNQVLEFTRRRLAQAGLLHSELVPLFDVDEPSDLVHVPEAWFSGASPAVPE